MVYLRLQDEIYTEFIFASSNFCCQEPNHLYQGFFPKIAFTYIVYIHICMLKSNNVAYCFSELECMYFCVEISRNIAVPQSLVAS
mgnify:CR=1 FL=1